jgi:DNA-binding MarR family transcriptional regulator
VLQEASKKARGRQKNGTERQPDDERQVEHIELRIWLRLLSCTTLIENIVKSKLRQEFGISLARFDILSQLERFSDGLTMSELSRHLMVSNGAITALAEKLAREKLITREEHPEDKRTVILRLTEQGRSSFLKMAKRHEEWVISLLGDMSPSAQTELLRSLVLLKRRLSGLADSRGALP